MRRPPLYLAIALCLAGCGRPGGNGIPAHPTIAAGQIERDAEAGLPSSEADSVYEDGEIEVLETNYFDNQATIVLSAGTINVGSLVPADVEGLKPDIRPKAAKTEKIPYRLRLEYEWIRGEWRLRRRNNLTFEKR